MKADQELRSLKRGLKVLSLLNHTDNISITELARHLGLPRTTAERILLTLVAEGYVQRVPDDKRYRLSAKVCSLAGGFSDDCWIVQVATPLLFKITEVIGWPLAIATATGDRMVLRSTTDAGTSLWLNRRRVGAETPLLNSSSGLVAYAFADDSERRTMHEFCLSSDNPHNRQCAGNTRALDMLIEPVRANGFAFQPPPRNQPEQSIAFPIFVNGKYAASLLMIYMTQAMSSTAVTAKYVPHLRKLADRIGAAAEAHEDIDLGFAHDFPPFLAASSLTQGRRATQ